MIKVSHLTKRYGTHCAVKDVSFEIAEGEIVGFLGPNGAGKSTTMNILTGCLAPDEGSVEINGCDIAKEPLSAKRALGYLPEQPPLYPDMTVEEYLSFVYDLKGAAATDKPSHLENVMKEARIGDVRARLIGHLSKGYRQRVGIAATLVGDPPVLIFDEPTVGLDPKQIIEVRNLLRNLGKKHTVILSTHILSEVQAVCNRLLVIHEGELIADRPTEELTRTVADGRRYRAEIEGAQNEVIATLRAVAGVRRVDVLERRGDVAVYRIESGVGDAIGKPLFFALAEKRFPLLSMEPVTMELEEVFLQLIERTGNGEKQSRGKRA